MFGSSFYDNEYSEFVFADSHPEDIGTLASFQKKLKKEIMSYLNAVRYHLILYVCI